MTKRSEYSEPYPLFSRKTIKCVVFRVLEFVAAENSNVGSQFLSDDRVDDDREIQLHVLFVDLFWYADFCRSIDLPNVSGKGRCIALKKTLAFSVLPL